MPFIQDIVPAHVVHLDRDVQQPFDSLDQLSVMVPPRFNPGAEAYVRESSARTVHYVSNSVLWVARAVSTDGGNQFLPVDVGPAR